MGRAEVGNRCLSYNESLPTVDASFPDVNYSELCCNHLLNLLWSLCVVSEEDVVGKHCDQQEIECLHQEEEVLPVGHILYIVHMVCLY